MFCLTHCMSHFTLQDDPLLFDSNVEQRVKDFIDAAIIQVGRFYP